MRYSTPAAFRRALEDRLAKHSQDHGIALVRLRKQVVFERLLARLLEVAKGRWALKGALALDFRYPDAARATKDMDLTRNDDVDAATADFLAAQTLDLRDFFTFAVEARAVSSDAPTGTTARYRLRAEVAGRLFEEVLVDVGFGDGGVEELEWIKAPPLLQFADISPAEVPALSLEEHIAEKTHAYTRRYGGRTASSRPKDLIDIVLVAGLAGLDAAKLSRSLERTFRRRATHALPAHLPEPPADWAVPYRGLARTAGISEDLMEGHRRAARFLDPVLDGSMTGRWDPQRRAWGTAAEAADSLDIARGSDSKP